MHTFFLVRDLLRVDYGPHLSSYVHTSDSHDHEVRYRCAVAISIGHDETFEPHEPEVPHWYSPFLHKLLGDKAGLRTLVRLHQVSWDDEKPLGLPHSMYLPAHTCENKDGQEVEVNYFQYFRLKRYGKAI